MFDLWQKVARRPLATARTTTDRGSLRLYKGCELNSLRAWGLRRRRCRPTPAAPLEGFADRQPPTSLMTAMASDAEGWPSDDEWDDNWQPQGASHDNPHYFTLPHRTGAICPCIATMKTNKPPYNQQRQLLQQNRPQGVQRQIFELWQKVARNPSPQRKRGNHRPRGGVGEPRRNVAETFRFH